MEQKEKQFNLSWFFKWFLDNKAVTFFLVTLLLGLNIFILSKISFLFLPVLDFLSVVMLPVILSGLLFYLLNPLVDLMEKYKINRVLAISIIFVVIAILLIWGLAVAIPNLQHQVVTFARNVPSYLKDADKVINDLVTKRLPDDFRPQLEQVLANFSSQATSWASDISSRAVNWLSALISATSQVIVALIIMPFMLFYLLRDGKGLRDHITQFLPTKFREPVGKILTDVNQQLSNYVRGQITVAVIVAIMFIIFFKIIGLRYAVTLGISAGVSPLILGSQLNIHPITILFVLLTSGSMFGIWGVLLGIPIYASAKVVISAIFEWYKSVSALYDRVEEVESEQ